MGRMSISLDLTKLWLRYIADGKIINIFDVGYDDPGGQWTKGDRVKVGLQMNKAGQPEFYAENLTQKRLLHAAPEKIEIGQNFKKCFFPHRLLRGDIPRKRNLGRQAAPSDHISKCNYHCQDSNHHHSLLSREPLCMVSLPAGRIWVLYYNFSPFEESGHLLWIPAEYSGAVLRLPHLPQTMTEEFLSDIMTLFGGSSELFYFFNSIHAGATQHHFHCQMIHLDEEILPIENAASSETLSYRFLEGYPIECLLFATEDGHQKLWHCINRLQQNAIPFNLLMIRKKIFLIPRDPDNEIVEEFPFGVLASAEIAGRIILSDRKNFEDATYDKVKNALKKSGLSRDKIILLIK